MSNIIVIGGGPAGMMAAIKASEFNEQVVLLEKNEKLGKKLYITGKGRCNVTNDSSIDVHMQNQCSHAKFLYSAFYTMDSQMVMDFFETQGLSLKVERGGRVFPKSDKSSDVIRAMETLLKEKKVEVRLKQEVKKIIYKDQKIQGLELKNGESIKTDRVIIATGGISYAMTGSTGDGYRFAKEAGHLVTDTVAALVPLETIEQDISELQGLALKNVQVSLVNKKTGKVHFCDRGEMLFTHFGVSGPLILSASSYLPKKDAIEEYSLVLDMKPALDESALDRRLLRDFEQYQNKTMQNAMKDLLPKRLIPLLLARAKVPADKVANQLTKEERLAILSLLKSMELPLRCRRGLNEAIITKGGVDLSQVDPHTMESKCIKGLYFAGEVLDLDALTGGFNLQIAFATGALAGLNI